ADEGTVSIVQPLIAPLYGGRSVHEVLSAFSEGGARSSYDIVRSYWLATAPTGFDQNWRKWLHDGVIPGTAFAPKTVAVQASLPAGAPAAGNSGELEVVFRPDPSVYDGRFANNAW